MAGSPIFSVNFTNRRNSAVLNYHKSWSWSESLRVSSLKYTQHYLVDVYMMKQAQLQKGTNAWRLFPPVFRGGRGRDPFNQNSDREKWSTSKGGPLFSKRFRLDRTDPLSFGPKFPDIFVEWIAPQFCLLSSLLPAQGLFLTLNLALSCLLAVPRPCRIAEAKDKPA